jgi:hypothetical protein
LVAPRAVVLPWRFTENSCLPAYARLVSGRRPSAGARVQRARLSDPASRRWVEQLQSDHPRHEQAVAKFHDVLQRAAFHELHRRRGRLGSLARHAWRHHPPSAGDLTFDRLPDTLAAKPGEQAERRELLTALRGPRTRVAAR